MNIFRIETESSVGCAVGWAEMFVTQKLPFANLSLVYQILQRVKVGAVLVHYWCTTAGVVNVCPLGLPDIEVETLKS